MSLARALDDDALWDGEMVGLEVGGRKILLVRIEGEVCAYADRCPHAGGQPSLGRLEGGVITCPVHCWEFEAKTGACKSAAAPGLVRCPVVIEGGAILVDASDRGVK